MNRFIIWSIFHQIWIIITRKCKTNILNDEIDTLDEWHAGDEYEYDEDNDVCW